MKKKNGGEVSFFFILFEIFRKWERKYYERDASHKIFTNNTYKKNLKTFFSSQISILKNWKIKQNFRYDQDIKKLKNK